MHNFPAYELYQLNKVIKIIEGAKSTAGILTVEFMTKYNIIWHDKFSILNTKTKLSYCAEANSYGDKCLEYIDYAILSIGYGQMEMNEKMLEMHTERIEDAISAVKSFTSMYEYWPSLNPFMAERFYKLATVIMSSKHLPKISDDFKKAMDNLEETVDPYIAVLYPDSGPTFRSEGYVESNHTTW